MIKNPPSMQEIGDVGLIPGSGRCPGGGNGNPLQYPYLENTMDRGAWLATVHGVAKRHDQATEAAKVARGRLPPGSTG